MKEEIILLFLINIGSSIGYGIVAPLFPYIAVQRGISESIIGLVIGAFAIGNSMIIPFTQTLIKIYSKRKIFLLALFTEVLLINKHIYFHLR